MLFYVYGFCTYSRFGNNFGGLNLGVSNERQFRALLFLGLGNLIHYNIFSSVHLPAYFTFFLAEQHHIVYMCHDFIIHTSAEGHLGLFRPKLSGPPSIAEQVSLVICQRVVEPGLTVDLFLDL